MNRLMRLTPLLLAVLVALLGAAPAIASTRGDIISDCSDDGQLQGTYKPSALRDARQHLPSDVSEYTDCSDVLRRAELPDNGRRSGAVAGPSSAPGGPVPGGGAPPAPGASSGGGVTTNPILPSTAADQQALAGARQSGAQPVTVGGQKLLPSTAALRTGYKAGGLPASLVVALVLLGLAGLALSFPPVRRRLPFRRPPR